MKITITLSLLFCTSFLFSQECGPITASSQFIHGNLQFNILNGNNTFNELNYKVGIGPDGDMDSREYAPIIYSSNLWAGGKDPNGTVKFSAGTYTNQDWVSGTLDENGQTTEENCLNWDRVFTVTKEDIVKARKVFLENGPCEDIPESVINWPGRRNPNLSFLPADFRGADYWDENGTGTYDPCDGDLPILYTSSPGPPSHFDFFDILPSQISYYVMNDNGKLHSFSGGIALQMEVGVYIFSYKAPEVEDVIFIKYQVKNNATDDLRNFHFGNWFDFDLGCSENDFLGTDPERHMVYVYNSNEDQECNLGGTSLPAAQFGITYLEGMREPFIIVGDSLVVPPIGSGLQDTLVRSKMKTSIIPVDCQDNTTPNTCNPQSATEFYNILRGINKDGSPILDDSGNEVKMMYSGNPSDSDSWSLCNEDKLPATTTITSVGAGLLRPGASNEILLALFHTKDQLNEGCLDIAALQYKQEQVQSFYYNNFFHHVGPPPPTLDMSLSSNEITISISDIPYEYSESIPEAAVFDDNKYNFEGIKIFQVSSPNFDLTELNNTNLSRLLYQGDINNEITEALNWEALFTSGSKTLVSSQKVDGKNIGILDEIIFDFDYLKNEPFIQGKPYYFVAISYAYNNFRPFDLIAETGQKYTYLESTCGVNVLDSEVLLSNPKIEEVKPYQFYNSLQSWSLQNNEGDLNARLISSSGQQVKEWVLAQNTSIFGSEVGGLPAGVYFLNIYSQKRKKTYAQKLVILR